MSNTNGSKPENSDPKWINVMTNFMIRNFKIDEKFRKTIKGFIEKNENSFRKAYGNTLKLYEQPKFKELTDCKTDQQVEMTLMTLLDLGLHAKGELGLAERSGMSGQGKRKVVGNMAAVEDGKKSQLGDDKHKPGTGVGWKNDVGSKHTDTARKAGEEKKIMSEEKRKELENANSYRSDLIDFLKSFFSTNAELGKFAEDYVNKHIESFVRKYPTIDEVKKNAEKFRELAGCSTAEQLRSRLNAILGIRRVSVKELTDLYEDAIRQKLKAPVSEKELDNVLKTYVKPLTDAYKSMKNIKDGVKEGDFDKCGDCKGIADLKQVLDEVIKTKAAETWNDQMTEGIMKKYQINPDIRATVARFVTENHDKLKARYPGVGGIWEDTSVKNLGKVRNDAELKELLQKLLKNEKIEAMSELGWEPAEKRRAEQAEQEADNETQQGRKVAASGTEWKKKMAQEVENYKEQRKSARKKVKEFFQKQLSIAITGTSKDYRNIDVSDLYQSGTNSVIPVRKYIPAEANSLSLEEQHKALKIELGGKKSQPAGRRYYLWNEMMDILSSALEFEKDPAEREKRREKIVDHLREFELEMPDGKWKPLTGADIKRIE